MTLAMAPVGFFPALFIALPAFLWMVQTEIKPFRAFLSGWVFGAGYFIFGFYWVSAALFVDISQWIWVLPFSLIAGPGLFALYWGFPALAAHYFRSTPDRHALFYVAALSLTEYARGHWMTGFPWNLPGYAWHWLPPLEQMASIGSVYFLTMLTLLWATLPVYRHNKVISSASILVLALSISFGTVRLLNHPTTMRDEIVRIVQPNIPQGQKWDRDKEWRNFENMMRLVSEPSALKPSLFVLPETAVNADLSSFPEIAGYIARQLPDHGILITGNLRVTEASGLQFFNSMEVVDRNAHILGTYDKHHLVPFGEFIPYRDKIKIKPVAAAVSGIGDFTRGKGPQTLSGQNFPAFSPLICYEVIFPGEVVSKDQRPEWLVNATNDAWYGNSSGPYQHLDISRMRAIEHGLPMARAANTGISAMIDPVGRVIARKNLNETGFIESALPEALPPTLYDRWGDMVFFLSCALVALSVIRRNP